MDIIAHRGASAHAPENTLAALRLALRQGAQGVEVDVHLTRDKQLAVIHDPTTARTGDRNLKIPESSSSDLRSVDVGSSKHPRWKGEAIPMLCEVTAALPASHTLLLELKTGPIPDLTQSLVRMEKGGQLKPEQTWFMSFRRELLDALKAVRPAWRTLLLLDHPPAHLARFARAPDTLAHDGLGLSAQTPVSPADARVLTNSGFTLSVWVENNPARAAYWRERGFRFLTTDFPDRFATSEAST